jgi:DNA-binding response OmpR family regulator
MNMKYTHTVLIISDANATIPTREALFQEKNCIVISETSPRDALKTAQLYSPSLIILDLNLPHPERLSLCRELRQGTTAKLLVLSPEKDEQKIYEYFLAGVHEHLTTPLAPIMLVIKSMAWLVRQDWLDTPLESSRIYT